MRTLLTAAAALALAIALTTAPAAGQGKGKAKGKGGPNLPPPINLTITGFADGGMIPAKNTCAAGQGSPSPAMRWSGFPDTTQITAELNYKF